MLPIRYRTLLLLATLAIALVSAPFVQADPQRRSPASDASVSGAIDTCAG
jgi:hypothetical protein